MCKLTRLRYEVVVHVQSCCLREVEFVWFSGNPGNCLYRVWSRIFIWRVEAFRRLSFWSESTCIHSAPFHPFSGNGEVLSFGVFLEFVVRERVETDEGVVFVHVVTERFVWITVFLFLLCW